MELKHPEGHLTSYGSKWTTEVVDNSFCQAPQDGDAGPTKLGIQVTFGF